MKFRRSLRFHGLKRPRVRQTWNKYNLYMLSRLGRDRNTRPFEKTFFQQKWTAKALTRGYHGEHIKERQWERMFSRRLLSVVNMDPAYMAKNDGSEQAAGRGSGRDVPPTGEREAEEDSKKGRSGTKTLSSTPYMQMTFAPMERRLDIAVFRALFASSARQARQFVIHGAVKVNGKKMVYPGYLLNPGDMFQVDVDRVMFATGEKKDPSLSILRRSSSSGEDSSEAVAEGETESGEAAEESSEAAAESTADPAEQAAALEKEKDELKALRARVKSILDDPAKDLKAKQKRALRSLSQDVKSAMSRLGKRTADVPQSASGADSLKALFDSLRIGGADKSQTPPPAAESAAESAAAAATDADAPREKDGGAPLTAHERARLNSWLAAEATNPYDPSKPYRTPWRPRFYMSAFAFIPRYLEVNQKICAAVYLRHPVARVGAAEVPTPFTQEISQLAFNWYLRRG